MTYCTVINLITIIGAGMMMAGLLILIVAALLPESKAAELGAGADMINGKP